MQHNYLCPKLTSLHSQIARLAPGVLLACVIAIMAWCVQRVQEQFFTQALFEALVVAILLGMIWRTIWRLSPQAAPGVAFTGKGLLETAVMLLGASINLSALLAAGPWLLGAIVLTVGLGIVSSNLIGRLIGLNPKLAILVAVGNSICGNSAIAAVAPLIEADPEDVASSIALTAVLGVVIVLGLPLLINLFRLSFYQYGVLAGLTVYAVPQVLAATFPVSTLSGEVGTLVKLVRVLMLGPLVLLFSLSPQRRSHGAALKLHRLLPWFIVGFLGLAVLRSLGILPTDLADLLREISRWLTVAAMAALGLSVDIRALKTLGWRVALAVIVSLLCLITMSLSLILIFHIGAG